MKTLKTLLVFVALALAAPAFAQEVTFQPMSDGSCNITGVGNKINVAGDADCSRSRVAVQEAMQKSQGPGLVAQALSNFSFALGTKKFGVAFSTGSAPATVGFNSGYGHGYQGNNLTPSDLAYWQRQAIVAQDNARRSADVFNACMRRFGDHPAAGRTCGQMAY